ncbi:MAG: DNA ligase LigA-related protein, partial [Opitutaceae bacterium]
MTSASTLKRIEALRAEIKKHDELYHRAANPEIEDAEYDALKRDLAELEGRHPEFASADSPTQAIGDDRAEGFEVYRHRQPMQSLDNTYSEGELRAFGQRLAKTFGDGALTFVVEPKIDGVAVSVTYEKGKLARAVTRGNGIEGDDITVNARHIASLPHALAGSGHPDVIEIRGEIYMTLE